mmetsp:Transcript_55727/g.124493  ORF Transcript_55727/g.124493 Transcript_55727/m.124493 type:complete len:252 (-) Transcript_55727:184-939(-)
MFARLLQPKQEPALRATALSVLHQLLSCPEFARAPELDDWAEHMFAVLLIPNLVWRSGKAAEHVRHAAMRCLSMLAPLPPLTPKAIAEQLDDALPVITSCLDDDLTETRRLSCCVVDAALAKMGSTLTKEAWVRSLYPELLKRLDDANDAVRVRACAPLASLCAAFRYSTTYDASANFDKTNYQYLLRGLLVHLDDPSPEIQQPVMTLLEQMMNVDPPVFAGEVRAVRDRHRTTKLCDKLIEQATALGQLV